MTPETLSSLVVYDSALVNVQNRKAYQDLESTVESHLQVTLLILSERPEQTLFENGSHERIGDDHETVGSVGQRLHLE